jgi:hypothetical protein
VEPTQRWDFHSLIHVPPLAKPKYSLWPQINHLLLDFHHAKANLRMVYLVIDLTPPKMIIIFVVAVALCWTTFRCHYDIIFNKTRHFIFTGLQWYVLYMVLGVVAAT